MLLPGKIKYCLYIGGMEIAMKKTGKKKVSKMKHREYLVGYACALPAIIGVIALMIVPICYVIYISMTRWTAISSPKWIGLENYKKIFTDVYMYRSLFVTVKYAVGAILFSLVYAFVLALMLNTNIRGKTLFRSIFFLPYVMPAIGVTILWSWIYNADFGVMNSFTSLFGAGKSLWIYGEKTAIVSLWIMAVWVSGNYIIIFLAGLQGVPQSLVEAVAIDGGNAFHKLIYVTIPMVTPTIFFNFLMGMINHLQNFIPVYAITQGGPNNATLFTVYYLVREAFTRNNFGYASAIAVVFFVVISIITAIVFVTSKKWVYYGGE